MSKIIWDNFKELGEVQRSKGTKYVVQLVARDGTKYLNIREFYKRQKDNEWRPGRNGTALPIFDIDAEQNEMKPAEELIKLLKQGLEQADEFEIEGTPVLKE